MTTDYSKLKVTELKDLIKDRGIAQTGLKVKQQFIEALEAQDAENGDGSGGDAAGEADKIDEAADTGATESATAEDVEGKDAPPDGEANGGDDSLNDDSETTNKRKRSATSEIQEESASKKLKAAEEDSVEVKGVEDVVAEAPAPVDTEISAADKVLPHGSSDDVQRDASMDDSEQTSNAAPTEPRKDSDQGAAADATLSGQHASVSHDDYAAGPPSRHPRSRALYIRELLRPLQPNALREHLETIAQSADSTSGSIDDFHLDKMRTHAFVLFDSAGAASRVRAALHNKKWPDEAMRKPLWVDYIPDDKVREWIDIEVTRGDNTRWEVAYESTGMDTDTGVIATLQEVDARPSAGRQPSINSAAPRGPSGAGEGMPNAPSGPRQRSGQTQAQAPPHSAPPPTQRAPENRTFDSLDQRYSFTEMKPKLYYQPVPGDLAQRRLDDLAASTSRDWNDRDADPSAYAEGELFRYTFEDGDRLVDGGADFGLFGRRGRGGGFGPRGDRGGRGRGRGGGDSYRGGGRRPYA
ncbi:hypothetical protein CLAFUW4_06005 [Fulvia fulva]|uniref:SAP domain-containing protein n=1 Tax=Passalora fulva TaxID=5499 RepID=A0A9Q8P9A4_PASFU|nr:uncharacterized protein CLAFUR5_06149 [Fulvia fulva]KAK4623802.1 hypothetical protein CLAFUR4_06010 [Fulvia fulva]KAK4625502.1 hypothetical protein CLAFUR0_06013 [Fulvia fulva]UJO17953.1 hypothetical protein CLAFUR5_06149 [Fulvia fulva]WPV15447.1 hypothetical protein CLAFUW4_06005 [Fulvia fulva]WPV30036.1 hypothetical protein CLAFUW7_06003 [Fulvia fulva]